MNQARLPSRCRQALSRSALPSRVCSFHTAASVIDFSVDGRRKQSNPTRRDFFVSPCGGSGRLDSQYNVDVVAHHRIGIDANGKDLGQLQHSAARPTLADARRTFRCTDQPRTTRLGARIARCSDRSRACPDRQEGCGRMSCPKPDEICTSVVCRKTTTRDVGSSQEFGCPRHSRLLARLPGKGV